MNALASTAVGVVIVVLLLTFVGIWIWAWLPYHKKNFEQLARMPMLDLQPASPQPNAGAFLSKQVAPGEDNE